MDMLALLVLEAATVAAAPAGATCDASGTEIVVCARRLDTDRYRLPAGVSAAGAKGPPRAEWDIGGGVRAGVALQPKSMQQGVVSNRVMATIKIPF